jgi:RimJ/RimL family protein N-acetyltransferase
MIQELPCTEYEKILPLFGGWDYNNRVLSLIGGYSRGMVFVDNVEAPHTALAWIKDMFYLAGEETNAEFITNFNTFLSDSIIPLAKEVHLRYFAVQVYPLERWEKIINELLDSRDIKINTEWKFKFNQDFFYKKKMERPSLPPGYTIERVHEKKLRTPSYEKILENIEQSCTSVDRFLRQGTGFSLEHDNTVIASCLSVYVTGRYHEILIDTYDPQQRNRGFATAVAQAYLDHCMMHGWIPLWTADEINAASIAVAQNLGFEKVGECPDFYFMFG